MKVLFLLSIGLDRQATSRHLMTAIVRALCESGNEVHIIQKDTGGDLPAIPEELSGFPVTTTTIPFRPAGKSNFVARFLAESRYVAACKRHIPADCDAAFVQSTTVAGFSVKAVKSRLPDANVTFNAQDIFPYNAAISGSIRKDSLIFRMLRRLQGMGYRKADHIITISEDMKELLAEDGVPEDKIEVIYNWSYQDEPYRDLDISAVGHMFDQGKFHVVYAGNIGVMQNVELLIETAKLMKDDTDVWFHLIGEGVRKAKLEETAKAYGLTNITFWPMQPSETAPLIYSAASVNVIPLQKDIYRTALPSKTATCLACGRPIIFAIGKEGRFAHRVMQETDCTVVESDDAAELAEAIRNIKESGAEHQKTEAFFTDFFRITKNSKRYAEIITAGNGR